MLTPFIVRRMMLRKKYKLLMIWKNVKPRLLYILIMNQLVVMEGHIIIITVPLLAPAAVVPPKSAALSASRSVANAVVLVARSIPFHFISSHFISFHYDTNHTSRFVTKPASICIIPSRTPIYPLLSEHRTRGAI